MEQDAKILIARLIAHGPQPKAEGDELIMRVLTDQSFRSEVDRRLTDCGLQLLDNPFASHISLGLDRSIANTIFRREDHYLSNTLGLSKSEIALLMIIWALIIMPKRQRQQTRESDDQAEIFKETKPIPHDRTEGVKESLLIEDFPQIGKPTYIKSCLTVLGRHGFIQRENGIIREGPLLDLAFDYNKIAQRIIEGALGDYSALLERNATKIKGSAGRKGGANV